MKLVPIWKRAWKLSSLQLAALIAALNAAAYGWVSFNGYIPPLVWASVNMGLGIAAAVARVVQQPSVTGGQDEQP
ncbi:DUF7940 domain-containing protein [Pseudomonas turukhanskensis]|uniref:Uncharacterized protein n=1 Tax=Pseudomonas turukhanskensis TaxID=1806536 RepID=A0A9W6K3W5_9PSED|nr:hypothetical protein [Pseudomonas turukhanskensis]GLK88307.1 hypothetical protein GCM10017655_13690 [Pseudomonas turukhanskensis]